MDSYKCSADALLKFYDEDKKVLDVIDEIEKELSAQNKVVCQFAIDGKALTTQSEITLANRHLSQIKNIEYIVADILTLTIEVAQGWVGAIDEHQEPLFQLAEEMAKKPTLSTYKKLEQVYIWCSEFVESLESLKIHRTKTMDMLSWDQLEHKLSGAVRELLQKSEKKDFKGAAYAIEYDLTEVLQHWKKELEKFVAEIGRSRGSEAADASSKKATDYFVGRGFGKPGDSSPGSGTVN